MPTTTELDDSTNLLAALEVAAQKERPATETLAREASVQGSAEKAHESEVKSERLMELGGILALALRHDLLAKSAHPEVAKTKRGWNISRLIPERSSTLTVTPDGTFIIQKGGRGRAMLTVALGMALFVATGKILSGLGTVGFLNILNGVSWGLLAALCAIAAFCAAAGAWDDHAKRQPASAIGFLAVLGVYATFLSGRLCLSYFEDPMMKGRITMLIVPLFVGWIVGRGLTNSLADRLGWKPAAEDDITDSTLWRLVGTVKPEVERLGQKMPAILDLPETPVAT